jgi:hypothetical protein
VSYPLVWFFCYSFAQLAWFALVVWLCIVLYRFLRLPALPWIACRYALAFVAGSLTPYAFRHLFPAGSFENPLLHPTAWHLPAGAWILCTETLIESVGDLFVALLAFAEVAFLVNRAYPDIRSWLVTFLLAVRKHVRTLGIAACVCTASVPITALLVLWIHGPFASKV